MPAIDLVRFACSGTEATMHAIRVARAFTGREIILKFEGNYHGFQDHTLWSTYSPSETYGNPRSPIAVPSSSGIPKSMRDFVITLPFNDFEGFERAMRSYGGQIAAVITEPAQGNCGAILPQPGFLELIRKKTEEYGSVFILDEVKTGFRIANGGAQEYYRIQPDLATYAKALGNGYPIAAFGGKREIMSIIGHGVAQGRQRTTDRLHCRQWGHLDPEDSSIGAKPESRRCCERCRHRKRNCLSRLFFERRDGVSHGKGG